MKRTALLTAGMLAGPLYILIGALQILTREGFDLRHHPLSLMSNGPLGWIQIANFVVTGLLTVAGAIGIRRALLGGRGGTWGPLLIGIYGLSLVAAGIFVADPALGFPPGTAEGPPASVSLHGILHFAAGAIGFFSLIAACFVFARRFQDLGRRGWAAFSLSTGVVFLASFLGIATGARVPGITLVFTAAIILAWTWLSALSGRLMGLPRASSPETAVHSAGRLA